jgi:putative hemolysin
VSRATWQILLAVAALALLLGALGPALDAEPYGTPAPQQRDERGELAVFENQALAHCQQAGGENAAIVRLKPGIVSCADKHGRRNRSVITILHRSEQ